MLEYLQHGMLSCCSEHVNVTTLHHTLGDTILRHTLGDTLHHTLGDTTLHHTLGGTSEPKWCNQAE
jgi:hypothetical protein